MGGAESSSIGEPLAPLSAILEKEIPMNTSEVCGNTYDNAFRIIAADGATHTFDSALR
jgi:hypothetical protein